MQGVMRVPFVKMHGLGNDFIVLDARDTPLPEITPAIARALADRREGIGCDQLILLEPSASEAFRMRIFNSDGGEVEACGNASRAVALLHGKAATVETAGGAIHLSPGDGGATVDMGEPRFDWQSIPIDYAMDTNPMPLSWDGLKNPIAVNIGNPHVVFFVPDVWTSDLDTLGPDIATDPVFPQGVNVNVAQLIDCNHLRLRVWERGAGLTLACGTGACATAVAAIRNGFASEKVRVSLPGGDLDIEWRQGENIRMTGPATEAFRGTFEWDDYA
jgi:diaminopimelate epimerase